MKCPDCEGELKTNQKFGQGVWICTKCGWSWLILKLRKKGVNPAMEKVIDVFTLKDLLTESVYYLKVRCDVPEDLIRRIDKEIEKEVVLKEEKNG
jgi:hypothetical protein